VHFLSLMKPTGEGSPDAAKQKEGQGLSTGRWYVLEPSFSARASGLHLWLQFKARFKQMFCCLAALMFVQVFRLILFDCLTPKNCTLYQLQGEQGLCCTCFDLRDNTVILALTAHSHVISKSTV